MAGVSAYYNERDPYAAGWLRNLIAAGHVADGEVDERSIEDVRPDDLVGFTQCHFFAGIGVWSYALRLAQWPDTREVWTGSCPCQPFSVAGAGAGMRDERHLWPAWFWLIEQRRPRVVFGEQVEAAIRHDWLDLVQTDLEGIDYAVAPVGVPAAGVGAPRIRQRLWFVAESVADDHEGGRAQLGAARLHDHRQPGHDAVECGEDGGVDNNNNTRLEGHRRDQAASGRDGEARSVAEAGDAGWLANRHRSSPTNGHWRDADWLYCRDGKWRPVEPGTFPLAHGATARVGRLRAYGNAIVPQVAAEVIRAFMEVRP